MSSITIVNNLLYHLKISFDWIEKSYIFVMFWCCSEIKSLQWKGNAVRIRNSTRCCDARSRVTRDDGFVNYLPLSRIPGMGRLQKTGISQKTCHTCRYSKLSGRRARIINWFPPWNFPFKLNVVNGRKDRLSILNGDYDRWVVTGTGCWLLKFT